jgi:hypothetical protein
MTKLPDVPTAPKIVDDVKMRIRLLGKLLDLDQNLTDDEWNRLVYYKPFHEEARTEFKDTLNGIRSGQLSILDIEHLPPHARWLATVYTGGEPTRELCLGGSRYHKKFLEDREPGYAPSAILFEIDGLPAAVRQLQEQFPQVTHQVIKNIAIDETFEKIGRVIYGPDDRW